jgi:VCBS repeat-containing protein
MTALAGAMTATITLDGTVGTLGWNFAIADQLLDFMAFNETLTLTYSLGIADHHFGSSVSDSDTEAVTILLNGANDAPTLVPASILVGTFAELANTTGSTATDSVSGSIGFVDVDLSDRPSASIVSASQTVTWHDATHDFTAELTSVQTAQLKAAFTIAPTVGNTNTGSIGWTWALADGALDFLGGGEQLTIASPVKIDDGHGGTFTTVVNVTVNGANDAPIAASDTNGTAKKSTLTVGTAKGLLSNDTDPDIHDQGHLFVSAVGGVAGNVGHKIVGTYGTATIFADGSYTYVADKGGLPAKIVAQDVFTYTVADGHGGTDTDTLSIVVFNPGTDYVVGRNTTLSGGNGPDVVDGSPGHDILFGGNGPDVLIGGNGNRMTGGNGPDTFLFRPNFGGNTITDFDFHNDAIQLDKSIFSSIADLLSHTTDTANGAVINDLHGNTITLTNVTFQQLQTHQSDLYLV